MRKGPAGSRAFCGERSYPLSVSVLEGMAHEVVHGADVAAAEALAIGIAQFAGHGRVAELFAVFGVGVAVPVKVAARVLHAVAEALLLDFIELGGRHVPGAARLGRGHGRSHAGATHEVPHGDVVAAAEAVTVGFALLWGHVRVTELFVLLDIGLAMVVEVVAGTFDAVVEALPLDVIQLLGRHVPAPFLAIGLAITGRRALLGKTTCPGSA